MLVRAYVAAASAIDIVESVWRTTQCDCRQLQAFPIFCPVAQTERVKTRKVHSHIVTPTPRRHGSNYLVGAHHIKFCPYLEENFLEIMAVNGKQMYGPLRLKLSCSKDGGLQAFSSHQHLRSCNYNGEFSTQRAHKMECHWSANWQHVLSIYSVTCQVSGC